MKTRQVPAAAELQEAYRELCVAAPTEDNET